MLAQRPLGLDGDGLFQLGGLLGAPATVIDCHSRRLVGWAVADHMCTDLIADALTAARATRGSLAGAIFHSDHGGRT